MNSQIADILGFHFSSSDYALGAKTLLSLSDKKALEKCINDLEEIASKCQINDEPIPDAYQAEKIYKRFCVVYKSLDTVYFSPRELRMLIYAMYRIKDLAKMQSLVGLLDKNWRDRFLNGLLYYVLSNWDDAGDDVMQLVLNLMQKRLKGYEGKRDKYLLLKKNARFLTLDGPELLGLTLRMQDKGQTVACSLWNISSLFFGMSRDRLDLQFYSRLIVTYFEKDGLNKLDLMERVLDEHNYTPTAKRLIPSIILNENKTATASQKEAVKTLAVNEIGDPSEISRWKLSVGTLEEQERLDDARQLLEQWIKIKFITIFFDKCVNEPRRKRFWLDHADMISDFDIYCTKHMKTFLLQDERISKLVDRKVKVLNDKADSDLAALGMFVGNYYLIEFSEIGSGCIYIYKDEIRNPSYFYQLKKTHLPVIQSFMIDKHEGKLPHVSDWEETMTRWFRNHGLL